MSEVNKNIVQTFLQGKGLNNKAVAGVMGNIEQESNFDATATNSGSGAYGLFQWLGSRKDELFKFARNNNSVASNVETQLEFFWHELNTTEQKTKTILLDDSYVSASDYAEAFEKSFERSGGSAVGKRKAYAENFYSQMGESSTSSGHAISSGRKESVRNFGDYGLTWWGDIVKVVLILLIILTGVVLGVLSVNTTVNEII